MKLRQLTEKDVEVNVFIEEEYSHPEAHFDSGDIELDKEHIEDILSKLYNGNRWAWCAIRVEVYWNGLIGVNYLGACSFNNEKDFRQDPYYYDMVNEAMLDLNSSITDTFKRLQELAF